MMEDMTRECEPGFTTAGVPW